MGPVLAQGFASPSRLRRFPAGADKGSTELPAPGSDPVLLSEELLESGPFSCRLDTGLPCVPAGASRGAAVGASCWESGRVAACFWDGEGISSSSVELLQPLESLPLPGPSSAKPSPLRSHFATLEPGWFVQVILFGFSTLGRFPGTAKPKAKAEQEAGILARMGKSRDLGFFQQWDPASPLPL